MNTPLGPLDWKTTKELVKEGTYESLKAFTRSPQQQKEYRRHREMLLAEFFSLTDSIKVRVLGYEQRLELADSVNSVFKKRAVPCKNRICKRVLVPNEFPYFFEAGIQHDVLWSEKELLDSEVEEVVKDNKAGYEVIWFRNPVELQSVPDIWHVHILSKLADS